MDGIKESCKKFGLFQNINFIIGDNIAIPKAVNNALWTGVNFILYIN